MAAVAQHTLELLEGADRIWEEEQCEGTQNGVEGLIIERQRVSVRHQRLNVFQAASFDRPLHDLDHPARKVDAHDASGRAHGRRSRKQRRPSACAHIEHSVAQLQPRVGHELRAEMREKRTNRVVVSACPGEQVRDRWFLVGHLVPQA